MTGETMRANRDGFNKEKKKQKIDINRNAQRPNSNIVINKQVIIKNQ